MSYYPKIQPCILSCSSKFNLQVIRRVMEKVFDPVNKCGLTLPISAYMAAMGPGGRRGAPLGRLLRQTKIEKPRAYKDNAVSVLYLGVREAIDETDPDLL